MLGLTSMAETEYYINHKWNVDVRGDLYVKSTKGGNAEVSELGKIMDVQISKSYQFTDEDGNVTKIAVVKLKLDETTMVVLQRSMWKNVLFIASSVKLVTIESETTLPAVKGLSLFIV
jgi:hypothetical protein